MQLPATVIFTALCALALPAHAAVWYVAGSPGGTGGDGTSWTSAFQSIQQGVDAAQTGDEVWVAATTAYAEAVTIRRPGVAVYGGFRGSERHRDDRLMTLRSGSFPYSRSGPSFRVEATARGTLLDSLDVAGAAGSAGIQVDADNVVLTNNAIHDNDAGRGNGGGIRCLGNNVLIADNVIRDNTAVAGGGLYLVGENGRIERNQIRNNTADNLGRNEVYTGIGGGMYLRGVGMQVRNNVVAWNTAIRYFTTPAGAAAEGGGIYAAGAIQFVNNTLAHNTAMGTDGARGGGFSLSNGTFTLANNMSYRDNVRGVSDTATAVGGGIYLSTPSSLIQVTFRANYFYDDFPDAGVPDGTDTLFGYFPQFVSETDFHLTSGSPLIDIGSNDYVRPEDRDADFGPRLIGRTVDIGAYEFGTPTTEPTLSRAYVRTDGDDRNDGGSWEAARRSVASAVSVTKPGGEVWVAGGEYADRVTLKAGLALYGGFNGTETASSARNPHMHRTVLDGGYRGSVVVIPRSAVGALLDGFTIRHGSGTVGGAADTSGGGIVSAAPNVTIANNIIEDNHVYGTGPSNWPAGMGGGGYLAGDGLLVMGNIIRNNRVESYGMATAYAAFASALGGGLFVSSDYAAIINNLFTGNSAMAGGRYMAGAAAGGGLYPLIAGGIVSGNTFAYNIADPGLGLPYPGEQPDYTSPRYSNNIIAFNSGSVITGYNLPYYTNNLVYANERSRDATEIGRDGNIAADPLFANAAGGDYRLQPGSPAIDAGSNSGAFSAVDLAGHPRIQGAAVDMGAFEWFAGGPVTVGDAAAALRIAAGLSAATPDLFPRLNVDGTGTAGIDIRDVARLVREAAH